MSIVTRAALVPACLLLAGCNQNEAANQAASMNAEGEVALAGTPLTVDVHDVLSAAAPAASPNATQRRLYGKFEIRPPHPGEESILSNGGPGGACLLAQVPVQPKSCMQAEECDYSPTPGQPGAWHGYCLGANSAEQRPGTCWVNPIESCLRGQGPGSYETPIVNASQLYAQLGQQAVKWRLLGCLSGTHPPGTAPPCADPSTGKTLLVLGKIREVP
jgi:hypothetical protein